MAAPANITSDEANKYSPPVISDSLLADDSKKWREKVPIGIRFKPTDQVLAGYYLAGKVSRHTDDCPIFRLIKEVDVHQCEPSLLSSLTYDFGDGKMYFFTHSSKRRNVEGQVPCGFWKKTGTSCVNDKDGKKPIATKTTMGYNKKDQKSEPLNTQWFMNEYTLLDTQSPKQNDKESKMITSWTICVVYSRNGQRDTKKRKLAIEPSF